VTAKASLAMKELPTDGCQPIGGQEEQPRQSFTQGVSVRQPLVRQDGADVQTSSGTPAAAGAVAASPRTFSCSVTPGQQSRSATPAGPSRYLPWSADASLVEAATLPGTPTATPPLTAASPAPLSARQLQTPTATAVAAATTPRGLSPTSCVRRSVSYSQVPPARVVPALPLPLAVPLTQHNSCSPPVVPCQPLRASTPGLPGSCSVALPGSTPGSPRRIAPVARVGHPPLHPSSIVKSLPP